MANRLIKKQGEIIYAHLNDVITSKKADTILDSVALSYVLMLICAIIDTVSFDSKLKFLVYDSLCTRLILVLALLISFDIVPVALATNFKRRVLGISNRKHDFMLLLGFTIFFLGFIINCFISVAAAEYMSPAATIIDSTVENSDIASTALLFFHIFTPVITTCASFFLSYNSFNPLSEKIFLLESKINQKQDEIRRLIAIEAEMRAVINQITCIDEDDKLNQELMRQMYFANAVSYCTYVRDKLKQHIGTTSANNYLSQDMFAPEIIKKNRTENGYVK